MSDLFGFQNQTWLNLNKRVAIVKYIVSFMISLYNLAMQKYTTQEPIYALATAYSPSALAVIRASGEGVISLFSPFFTGKLEEAKTNTAIHGYILDKNNNKIDEVMVIKYTKGHGYTSEEAFEIMSHGSLPVIKRISSLMEECGIRRALKGEFTYRAFVHGKMDLTEAEAVEELVKAKGERSRENALKRLNGSIRREADSIKKEILDILASLEVYLDYGEDEIIEDWIFPIERVEKIIARLDQIARTYSSSRLYREGAKVVLAGRTNAGKSSLFNALLKENRAIVSSIAGTTRDYLEVECDLDGIPIRLFDTAGLRESSDEIEREGISRSEEMIENADLVVYVLDGNEEEKEKKKNTIYVHSKKDLTHREGLSFSSLTGEGLDGVINAIKEYLTRDLEGVSEVPIIESERQKEKIEKTKESLEEAIINRDKSADIIALFFQEALDELSELTGEVTTEDVLDVLFSSFCLGK